ncbi:MAG: hypothetical protein AAB628_01540 [Patescibacteria group bacterium]
MTKGVSKVPKPEYEKWQIVDVYERVTRGPCKGTPRKSYQGQIADIRIVLEKVEYQVRRIVIGKDLSVKGYENFSEPIKWISEELIELIK